MFALSILVGLGHSLQAQWLPNGMTPEEQAMWFPYRKSLPTRGIQSAGAPPVPVRTAAEWEPVQALVITWAGQQTILREITRHAVKECKVIILTNNADNVTSQLTSNGIPLDSVTLLTAPFNTIWVRDYGPWTVYDHGVDSLRLVDWIYNRPRPADDLSPRSVADWLDLPLHEAIEEPDDWVHTGGNHLTDGLGTAFSSMLVLEENPDKTEGRIDSIAHDYLGVDRYIKFPTLPFDGIHHLDMHMAVLDEETILFGEYPAGVADGPQIESNLNYLRDEYPTPFGNSYNIVRIPMPPDQNGRYPNQGGNYRTYTNSIFINKTILVPTYEERYDTTALRIYRELLPGYNVVGINCNSIISSLGALHCITKTVGVSEPLLISHARLRDQEDTVAVYPVTASIRHHSGIAEATLYYRLQGDSLYRSVPMQWMDTISSDWTAGIPAFPAGTEVQYYIQATANSGKTQVRPIVAPEGYFRFKVLGEPANQPPIVIITSPSDGTILPFPGEPVSIEFDASDPDGTIGQAVLRVDGDSVAMTETLPYVFSWTPDASGSYAISITVRDDDGAEAMSEPVHITLEESTATSYVRWDALSIYPNPASDQLFVRTEYTAAVGQGVILFDIMGQPQRIEPVRIEGGWILHIADLVPGIYYVSVDAGDTRSLGFFVRQ